VVFVTKDRTNLALYVDGVLSGAGTVGQLPTFSGNPVLGWSDESFFRKFAGSLDEVAIYPTALSADRVKAHYAAGGGQPPSVSCSTRLQTLIDQTPAGGVLALPACVYRETVTINKSMTLDGQGKAEVRGSDVWTSWSPSGGFFVSGNSVPNLGADSPGASYSDQFRGSHLEQVFLDGAPLTIVPSNPNASQFALDGARHVILGTNPAGHVVEVTTRTQWAVTAADNVTITNMVFHHAGTPAQSHAIGNDDHANFVLSNSTLTDVHGTIVGLGGGDAYTRILNNTLQRGGDLAIGSFDSGHALIQGNTISDNGWGGYNPTWQAGGFKAAAAHDLTVDGNTVFNNGGAGIWCDIACSRVTYSNNKVHDNAGPGLFFEISSGASIVGNAVWSHGRDPGIFISDSSSAEVANNTLAWNETGIRVISSQRPDRQSGANVRNYVHDNVIVMKQMDGPALDWSQYGPGPLFDPTGNSRGSNNRFWYPGPEDGNARFVWRQTFPDLASFANTPGGAGSQYLSQADRDRALSAAGIPLNA
jgi:hypothetical protein